jgi:hypothetical protein
VEEASYSLLQPKFWIAAGLVGNLVLCFLLVRTFSVRALLAYLIGYSLFLIPILSLPLTHMFANYLYASGMVFSIALAALLLSAREQGRLLVPALLLAVVTLHTLVVQRYFYKHGLCMNTMMTSLKAAYLDNNKPKHMSILTLSDAPVHSLRYYTDGRKYPVEFTVLAWNEREAWTDYMFDCDCLVRERPEIMLEVKKWGPVATLINKVANRLPDGTGAFWIKVDKLEEAGKLEVLLDGQPALKTLVRQELITASFPPESYAKAGDYDLEILHVASGKKIQVGTFQVK